MEINITQAPPTAADISAERDRLQSKQGSLERRERRIKTIGWIVLALDALWVAALWTLMPEKAELAATGGQSLLLYAGQGLVIEALAGATAGVAAAAGVAAVAVALAAAVAVAVAAAIAVAVVGSGAVAAAFAAAFAVAFAFTIAGTAAEKWLKNTVTDPLEEARETLASLTALSAETAPDQCEAVVRWCAEDETVRVYQNQVAEQDRPLVLAEHDAMSAWVNGAEQRQFSQERTERARGAYEALRNPIQPGRT